MTQSNSTKKKLASLAVGATALYAGVTGKTAEAAIIHVDNLVGADITSGNNSSGNVFWDIDSNAVNDLQLQNVMSSFTTFDGTTTVTSYRYTKNIRGGNSRNRLVVSPIGNQLQNLASGFAVGSTLSAGYQFDNDQNLDSVFESGNFENANGFTSGDIGFVGFQFDRAGQLHYGWAEVELTEEATFGTFEVLQWAWEDTPDTAIAVGATSNTAAAIPEPTSMALTGLGLLAMGAGGVRRWRKKKIEDQIETEQTNAV